MSAMYLNNPLRTLELRVPPASEGDIEATYAGLRDAALAIVWPSLRGSSAWSIECRPLLGGITNSIYLLSLRGGEQGQHTVSSVIARLFGDGTELFVDRAQENAIFARLSALGAGPMFFGLFSNGRIEGYLSARSLAPEQMYHPQIAPRIAHALADFHGKDACGGLEPILWRKIETFISLVQEKMADGGCAERTRQLRSALDVDHYINEVKRLLQGRQAGAGEGSSGDSSRAAGERFAADVVLCHNDLLSGNILLDNRIPDPRADDSSEPAELSGVTLIDFEYCGPNYRAFDIANHFCEYSGFDFTLENVKKAYPSRAYRRRWFRNYLSAHLGGSDGSEAKHVALRRALGSEQSFEELFDGFDGVLNLFQSTSHFFWGFWALFQSFVSVIDFDYSRYAGLRFAGYEHYFARDVFTAVAAGEGGSGKGALAVFG